MGDRQTASFERQACTNKCIGRSVSLPPPSPNFPLGDSTDHAALDVATLQRQSPTGEANHNHRQRDCLTLYRAALKGNWREAEDIILRYPDDIIRASITEMGDTVLHIASATKHATFVKKVVGSLNGKDLAQKNKCGDTAFCIAAESGIVTIAEEMLNKNKSLILIRNSKERTPLHAAALFGHRDMVEYLLPKTPFNNLTSSQRMEMLVPFQDLLTPTEKEDMLDAFKDLTPSEKMHILVATITHDMYGMPRI
ncbi:hypothetical protein RGQ29_006450 [Quercus rubra]|uniref:Uncharacterized protein n=1 Tax=Quercus rubra TaxID=3512 RepID=A0AAN7E6Y8_QUERU|nr:hypothetical protein RGQ29_006450 [Quercus rubra]KAK4564386.1 hypothetical protein RGQ29_006450 [Quercus rubra]KAK4564387.1 hypothetical protein RGQ29_006450 [Quercus rubra]KAK4564388.1 hypothetical protein RGQ29_006450 [Quercus rubra]